MNDNKLRHLIQALFASMSFVSMAVALFLGANGKTGGVATALICMILSMLMAFAPRLTELEFMKLRAKFQRTMDEAEEIMQRLRNLIPPLAELGFMLDGRATYIFEPTPRKDILRIERTLFAALESLELQADEIEKIVAPIHKYRKRDLRNVVVDFVSKLHKERDQRLVQLEVAEKQAHNGQETELSKEYWKKRSAMQKTITELSSNRELMTAQSIRDFVTNSEFFDSDEKERFFMDADESFKDLEHYESTNQLRRPEVWAASSG